MLGVSISHALVDGYSYFHFLSSWSRVVQGKRLLEPVHQRELLTPAAQGSQEPLTPGDVLARSGLFWSGRRQMASGERLREERLLISKAAMSELLAEAQADGEVRLFPNDVLTAHLWKRCVTQWDDGPGSPTTYVSCPVDFRRLVRAVPRTYFGAAICFVTATLDLESLASAPIGKLALLVRQSVAQVKQDYVSGALETLDRLRRQHGLGAMEEIHVRHPQLGSRAVLAEANSPGGAAGYGSAYGSMAASPVPVDNDRYSHEVEVNWSATSPDLKLMSVAVHYTRP